MTNESAPVLPSSARVLLWSCAAAAATAAAYALAGVGDVDWPAVAFLTVCAMLSERFDISLYGQSRISVSGLFLLTGAVSIGPAAVPPMALLVALAGHAGRDRPFHKLVFNASVFALSSLASAYVFLALTAVMPVDGRVEQAIGAIAAALADYVVSGALIAAVIGATSRASAFDVWKEKFSWLWPHFAAAGVMAFVLALTYRSSLGAWGMLGFAGPILMTRLSMKQYVDRTETYVDELREKNSSIAALSDELEEAYEDTLAAFTAALDHRDTETNGHSSRVSHLSTAIGERLGIRQGTRAWRDLKNGALLHDVGKIGVPDAVLRKEGPLTDEEWDVIRTHPHHGYEMLRQVHFLAGAAKLVLHHHERFDGNGYPGGLKGDAIPLAARIFAVADTFDAITSARPYKAARSTADAVAEILRNSGTQFDPAVVSAFMMVVGSMDLSEGGVDAQRAA